MKRARVSHVLISLFAVCALACAIALPGCTQGSDTAATEQNAPQSATTEQAATPDASQAKISYLGPEGTYTQEACIKFFNNEGECVPFETVEDAVKELVDGNSDYAVIPQENTIGGPVAEYLDTVLGADSLSIAGEVELPISQNLLVVPGTNLNQIKTVYSHKQGIAQSKDWLAENLPDAAVEEVSSTAEGARMVSEGDDPSCAAVASAGCADVYNLEVLATDIQQNDSNKTRFYVLTKDEPATEGGDRIAFVATGSAAGLPPLMAAIETQDMQLVAIHDRPAKTELGSYRYLVECSAASKLAYDEVSKTEGFEFRYLGCFSVV